MDKPRSRRIRLIRLTLVILIVLAAAAWALASRAAPPLPFRFLHDLQLADRPFSSAEVHGKRQCEYVYTGQTKYADVFRQAKAELTADGWKEDKTDEFARDGAKFIKAQSSGTISDTWVLLKRDAKVQMGSAGRLVTNKAAGWTSVRCLLNGKAPGFWDRLQAALRM